MAFSIAVFAQLFTLVLSAVVLVYWVFYSIVLYQQYQRGIVRKDWLISMVFYLGIAFLAVSNLILACVGLYCTPGGESISLVTNMIALVIFVIAFYLRMKSVKEQAERTATAVQKGGKKRR